MTVPDVRQVIYALERAERRLEAESDHLASTGDYNAEFPAEDAERMREAIRLLKPMRAPLRLAATVQGLPGWLSRWSRRYWRRWLPEKCPGCGGRGPCRPGCDWIPF